MTLYRARAYFYLVFVALIWGVATPVIKFTFAGIGPIPFLVYRFAISALLGIVLIIPAKTHLAKIIKHWRLTLTYSFITTTLALGILFLGLKSTTVLDTVLINTTGPLLTSVIGFYILKEHITKREKLGTAIAFAGTLFTVFQGGLQSVKLPGNLLIMVSVVIVGFSSLLCKKLMRIGIDPLALTNFSFIIGFITILPIALVKYNLFTLISQVQNLEYSYHAGVWYMALLSGTLAYSLWVKGQKTIEISEAALFAYLAPVFAAPLSIFWLGEKITIVFVIGVILITTGIIIAEYKKHR